MVSYGKTRATLLICPQEMYGSVQRMTCSGREYNEDKALIKKRHRAVLLCAFNLISLTFLRK